MQNVTILWITLKHIEKIKSSTISEVIRKVVFELNGTLMQKPCFYLFYVMFGRKKDLTDRFYNLKISYLDVMIGTQKNILEEKKSFIL